MSEPFCFLEGATYHVSQRCFGRKLKINPSKKVNNAILFCLCYSLHKYNIELHAFCFMSNHFHLILTDNDARLGDFMSLFNCLISRFIKAAFGLDGPTWDPRPYSKQILIDEEAIIDMIVYTIVNPVSARLVSDPKYWPGLVSLPKDSFHSCLKAERPKFYFSSKGRTPEIVEAQLTIPPLFRNKFTADEFKTLIEKKVRERVLEIQTRVRDDKSKFLGQKNILRKNRNSKPKSRPPRSKINPKVVCKDPETRRQVLIMLRQFRIEYREAFLQYRAGKKSVRFPQGTFKMKRDSLVNCRNEPTVSY